MELNKIYNEDCLVGMKKIPSKTIDLIVSDPPYIIDNSGGGIYAHDNKGYVKELDEIKSGFDLKILDECCRVMKKINIYPCFLDEEFGKIYGPYDDAFDAAETELKKNPTGRREKRAYNDSVKAILDLNRPSYKKVVDHIDHVVNLVGVDHVGLGSDFDGIAAGPKGLEDISKMPVITQELVDRGYSEADIKKILGENFLRVMNRVEEIAYTF